MNTWLIIFYIAMAVTIVVYAAMEKDKSDRDELMKQQPDNKRDQKKRSHMVH